MYDATAHECDERDSVVITSTCLYANEEIESHKALRNNGCCCFLLACFKFVSAHAHVGLENFRVVAVVIVRMHTR
jgi:hypothetical protein